MEKLIFLNFSHTHFSVYMYRVAKKEDEHPLPLRSSLHSFLSIRPISYFYTRTRTQTRPVKNFTLAINPLNCPRILVPCLHVCLLLKLRSSSTPRHRLGTKHGCKQTQGFYRKPKSGAKMGKCRSLRI